MNSKVRSAEEAVVGEGQQFEGITIHMLAEEVAVVPMILTYDGWHLSGFGTLRNFCGWIAMLNITKIIQNIYAILICLQKTMDPK